MNGEAKEIVVRIRDMAFDPPDFQCHVGDGITWLNEDMQMQHTVTSDDKAWDSNPLGYQDSFSYTTQSVGFFAYHCGFHPFMKGIVEVVSGSAGE